MTQIELTALRMGTEALIATTPTPVALTRPPALTADGAGGYWRSGSPVTLTTVNRYVKPIGDETIPQFQSTPTGQHFSIEHLMIGVYNDDIQEGDYHTMNGKVYTVVRINPDRTYQTKCELGTEVEGFAATQ